MSCRRQEWDTKLFLLSIQSKMSQKIIFTSSKQCLLQQCTRIHETKKYFHVPCVGIRGGVHLRPNDFPSAILSFLLPRQWSIPQVSKKLHKDEVISSLWGAFPWVGWVWRDSASSPPLFFAKSTSYPQALTEKQILILILTSKWGLHVELFMWTSFVEKTRLPKRPHKKPPNFMCLGDAQTFGRHPLYTGIPDFRPET